MNLTVEVLSMSENEYKVRCVLGSLQKSEDSSILRKC